ncbi:MAG: N-formylglutamate amidohydrolase [Pseudoprimorskyibacter sp.]|nr:N-formylglutamate amidohydrolase [Pseudoprimorskyibacter sp.]
MAAIDSQITEIAFEIDGAERSGPWLITCDHASNAVPPSLDGTLGLSEADMERHIAYDVGARGVSLALGRLLNSPVIMSRFSRLVIDPNRGVDDPTLVMRLYDGSIVPGNRYLTQQEKDRRVRTYYKPYHDALARLAGQPGRAICAVHSFTPQLRGRQARPWHIGVLFASDSRLSDAVVTRLNKQSDLCVGSNQPYKGHLPGDSMDRHAIAFGRHNTLIELRNDLIETPDAQANWAKRLAPDLSAALIAVT